MSEDIGVAAHAGDAPLLEIRDLHVSFATRGAAHVAVDGLDLSVRHDETLAIVGESGSGKSVAMLAVMGLLPWTAQVSAQRLHFAGQDLRTLTPQRRRAVIGRELAMIFQEPVSSLNPCFTVGFQIGEVLKVHLGLDRKQRRARAIELLEHVGIAEPQQRLAAFPHELSGGMCQRVMIAMALACSPRLLIADEPTTALDVTIQAQILDLLRRLRRETGMGLILITHDMGVVAEMADRVIVQYAGQPVETQDTQGLFADPHHPYTRALLDALPERAAMRADGPGGARRLPALPGMVPGPHDRPAGCVFSPRCAFTTEHCRAVAPLPAAAILGSARCHTPLYLGEPRRPGDAGMIAGDDVPAGTRIGRLTPAP